MVGRSTQKSGFECPHCGEYVPAGAKACRACGASDEYGWGLADSHDDYGDDDFDYDEFTAREFPGDADPDSPALTKRTIIAWLIVVLIASILLTSI